MISDGIEWHVVITKARFGYPAGTWVRVFYEPMAKAIVTRLAAEGVAATIEMVGP